MQPPELGRLEMIPLARRAGVIRRVADELAANMAASLADRIAVEARVLRAYGFDSSTTAEEAGEFHAAVIAAVVTRLSSVPPPVAREK